MILVPAAAPTPVAVAKVAVVADLAQQDVAMVALVDVQAEALAADALAELQTVDVRLLAAAMVAVADVDF